MPWYDYHAVTPGGSVITGQIEAESRDDAEDALANLRVDLRELSPAASAPRPVRDIGAEDLAFFNEQLAAMADAGIALDEGLAQLARDVESPRLRGWIEALVRDLRRGVPLEQAVAAHEQKLPVLYSRVIRAGVKSGDLPTTLLNLNEHLRMACRTRRILWETLSYPLLVAGFGLAVVLAFLTYLVPRFAEIFEDMKIRLPLPTRFLIDANTRLQGLVVAGMVTLVGLVVGGYLLRYSPRARAGRERVISALPMVGSVYRASLVARFLRSIATAVANGLGLPEALRLGAGATGSALLNSEAERLAQAVESGDADLRSTHTGKIIPQLFAFCVERARGCDTLPAALTSLANAYELRAEHTQTMMRTMIFPVVIIMLGGLVGCYVLALFLPLITMFKSIAG